ncbi:hypothetical protein EUGRSUZ_E03346 [Eucalyptus grandis]|uniref:Uncharacterized protein n=2 Tax=Eucalyptus grandis TaxID=71139 RepID=A0ACC3KZ81_EUCGR|nr:hypothetical protein EUGRSUZ_E03346 [Eucalyptus grandis]
MGVLIYRNFVDTRFGAPFEGYSPFSRKNSQFEESPSCNCVRLLILGSAELPNHVTCIYFEYYTEYEARI